MGVCGRLPTTWSEVGHVLWSTGHPGGEGVSGYKGGCVGEESGPLRTSLLCWDSRSASGLGKGGNGGGQGEEEVQRFSELTPGTKLQGTHLWPLSPWD